MKKTTIHISIFLALIFGIRNAQAVTVFNSNQIATSTPTAGYIIISNGPNAPASWAATSSAGLVSSVSSADGSITVSPNVGAVNLSLNPIQVDGSSNTTIDLFNRQLWSAGSVVYEWLANTFKPNEDIQFPNAFDVFQFGSDPSHVKSGLPLRFRWDGTGGGSGWLAFDDGAGNFQTIRANINADSVLGTTGSFSSLTGGTISGSGTGITGVPIVGGTTGTLTADRGGTGTTTFAAGSVVFATTSGTYGQDNSNLFWDDSNNRLGIGTSSPTTTLFIQGKGGTNPFAVASSTGMQLLTLLQNGYEGLGTSNPSFHIELSGTNAAADRKIGINGTQAFYLPDQTNFGGSLVLGNGGTNLSHSSGVDGFYDTILGIGSGIALTTGTDNLMVGRNAAAALTIGNYNVALGNGALSSATSSWANVAIGLNALANDKTPGPGGFNIAIGTQAMELATSTGSQNVAIGYKAMQNCQGCVNNYAIGTAAFSKMVGPTSNNTGLGNLVGLENTTGTNNTYVGYYAGGYNQAGGNNVAIGTGALTGTTLSNYSGNTSIGVSTLQSITTGGSNTAIGYNSGNGITSGANNTFIGQNAGYQMSTGLVNTFIGYGCGGNMTSGNFNLCVSDGDNISMPLSTGSNQMNIGNFIFATGMNGAGSSLSTGNVGIGTTTPDSRFSIQGTSSNPTTDIFNVATSTSASIFKVRANGNVGIGSSSPNYKLVVNGTSGNGQIPVFSVASSTNASLFSINGGGHIVTGGGTPAVTACGITPTISGNDTAGTVTVGTGVVTACTITFATVRANTPRVVGVVTGGGLNIAGGYSAKSTTAVTFSFAATVGGGTFDYYIVE